MRAITKTFPGVRALDEVDLFVEEGEIHFVVGENGAGKSTLMKVLSGIYHHGDYSGDIMFDEKVQHFHGIKDSVNAGIVIINQELALFPDLSVYENIFVGHEQRNNRGMMDWAETKRLATKYLDMVGLKKIDIYDNINTYGVGVQQLVEIAKALSQNVKLLILDEPTAVLTPQESQELFVILNSLKKRGTAIILISHKLEEVLSAADTITILRNGRRVTTTRLDACPMHKNELSALMVGRQVLFDFDKSQHSNKQEVVRIEHMSAYNDAGAKALDDVTFSIHKGEIVAIAGVDGNSNTAVEVLSGLRKSQPGEWFLDNEEMSHKTVRERIERGVAYIPEDRKSTGLVMDWGINDNLILKNYTSKQFSNKYVMKKKEIVKHSSNAISTYNITCDSPLAPINKLSGGNQQKVILAREISSSPSFLIASHPTRGLDVGAMEYIRSLLIEQRNNGTPILLISADLDEVFQCADRIIVFYNGRVMGDVPPTESIENIGKMMAGMIDE